MKWQLEEAYIEIKKLEPELKLKGKILIGDLYLFLGHDKKALSLAESLLPELIQRKDKYMEGRVRLMLIHSLINLEEHERGLKELDKFEKLFDQMKERGSGDERLLKIWEGNITLEKGHYNFRRGIYEQATHWFEKSLGIVLELGGKEHIASRYMFLGASYAIQGDLELGEKAFLNCLNLAKATRNAPLQAMMMFGLGYIQYSKGNYGKALDHGEKGLILYQKFPRAAVLTSRTLDLIGRIHHTRGDLQLAHQYLIKSLRIHQDFGSKSYFFHSTLFYLIDLSLDMKALDQTQIYLQQLHQLSIQTNNPVIKNRYRFAEAYVQKHSKRLHQRMSAYETFRQIIADESEEYELIIFSIISICELLLYEVQSTGEPDALSDMDKYLQKLSQLGQSNQSYVPVIEAQILRSKVSLINGDAEKAKKFLNQAQNFAETKNLHHVVTKIQHQQMEFETQIHKWAKMAETQKDLIERIDKAGIQSYIAKAVQSLMTQDFGLNVIPFSEPPRRKQYQLHYRDLITEHSLMPKSKFRVGIAQMGLSEDLDILSEFYEEIAPSLFGLKLSKVPSVLTKIEDLITQAHSQHVKVLLFPELAIDLNYRQMFDKINQLAQKYRMYIIPGSSHDRETKQNVSTVISHRGIVWQQEKHIPATIMYGGQRFTEGIEVSTFPRKTIVTDTEYGRMAVVICRDFLDMDLRVELKNYEPPVDLIFNLAFTPVTADFKAAHFDARRSIYAYCFFANIAEFGNSFIYTPEKERVELTLAPGEEGVIYKEVDLFKLRSERKKWELNQQKQKSFIQSTR